MFNGTRFKELRKKVNLSQADIAKILGKNRMAISSWESGHHTPSDSDIRIIASVLNVRVKEISTLQELQKGKTRDTSLLEQKIIEIDSIIDEFGDLPIKVTNKINELKENIINLTATTSRQRNIISRYELLADNLPYYLYIKNNQLKYTFINDIFLNLIGKAVNKEEIIGSGSLKYFGEKDYRSILEAEKKVLNQKTKTTNLNILIPGTKGGKIGLLNIVPIIEDGSVSVIVCSIRDITAIYKEEKARKELEKAINELDDVVWTGYRNKPDDMTEPIKYTFINESAKNRWGLPVEKIIKGEKSFLDFVHPGDVDKVEKIQLDPVFPKKVQIRYIVNNKTSWIEYRTHKKENILWGIISNISDKIEKSAKNEAIVKALNLASDAIWLTRRFDDGYGENLFFNKARGDLYGKTTEELLKDVDFWEKYMHPDDIKRFKKENLKINEKNRKGTLEYRLILEDGTIKYVEETKFIVPEQGVTYVGAIQRDVTHKYG